MRSCSGWYRGSCSPGWWAMSWTNCAPASVPAASNSAAAARHDRYWPGHAGPLGGCFEEKVSGTANKLMEKPFGLMLEALVDLKPHEIYLNTGSSPRNALWGELMRIRANSDELPRQTGLEPAPARATGSNQLNSPDSSALVRSSCSNLRA